MYQGLFQRDTQQTYRNRERLIKHRNILYWYQELYQDMFSDIENIRDKKILEIGSGTSPLTFFYPEVMTSDIMPLEYLDYVFDAHQIHAFDQIGDESLDIITLTNVLHHLKEPLLFLTGASKKLKTGGQIIFAEPYFSIISKWIFLHLHHEPSLFNIEHPTLDAIEGPLSSSNQALPFLIFFKRHDWRKTLEKFYMYSCKNIRYFSSLSYMATGGISRTLPIPHVLYKLFFFFDKQIGKGLPGLTASFFIARLTKR